MKGYKAFRKGLVCRDKQYAENANFEEAGGKICGKGMMHFCASPFDCLDFYPLIDENGDFSEFAEVEANEVVTDDNRKYATKKLHIGAKIDFDGFIRAGVDFLCEKETSGSSGDYAQIGSSGDGAKIGSSGDYAKITITGEDCVAAAIGTNCCIKAKKGNWITLAEWRYDDIKHRSVPVCVKSAFVDGETLKADVWYTLKNGEFVPKGQVNNA